ncbi:MAG: hypothetical protein V4494_07525 [Chlamydiota bacterium]
MRLENKTNRAFASALMLTCGLITIQAEASVVKVASTATNQVFARIVPGTSDVNSTYCWSCFSGCLGSDNCRLKNLYIPVEGIGTDRFTIVGTEGGILFNGTCDNLSTHKNYEVVFYDTFMGIGCKSTEL